MPGVDENCDLEWHPLIYDSTGVYGERALERLVAEFPPRPPESIEVQEQAAPNENGSASLVLLATRKDLRRLTSDLRRTDRDYPIVVLALSDNADEPAFTPSAIRPRLDPHIPIYILGSRDLSRRLGDALGPQLAVDGENARVFWPGVREHSDPAEHPLVPAHSEDRRNPTDRLIVTLELSRPVVRRHIAQIQARLERAEQQAADAARELREARADRDAAREESR
jgi:hypothetical protein